ncbi:MAG TPA: flagellar hook capping FlgD N-terminal domain-containing protein [Propionicimonas sp.]|uniref:flagellar hook assembly protein FlgD n=1 Tax=Propionicimonas sp. TaxID=1955623 RepID=UPI002F4110CC
MSIPATAPVASPSLYTTGSSTVAAPKKEMDKEVFLSLLVAQLRNQDPSSPMDTTQMMAQSSQLSSMEQLTGLADTTRDQFGLQMRMAAAGFMGQEVTFTDADGTSHTGVVTAASFDAAMPKITVGSWTVALDAISAISHPATTPAATPPVTTPATDPAAAGSSAPTA